MGTGPIGQKSEKSNRAVHFTFFYVYQKKFGLHVTYVRSYFFNSERVKESYYYELFPGRSYIR
jgi:hypothetical protein